MGWSLTTEHLQLESTTKAGSQSDREHQPQSQRPSSHKHRVWSRATSEEEEEVFDTIEDDEGDTDILVSRHVSSRKAPHADSPVY